MWQTFKIFLTCTFVIFWIANTFLTSEKKSISIKINNKIPSLLPSILSQSSIYMDVGISLLHFKYLATLKKTLLGM